MAAGVPDDRLRVIWNAASEPRPDATELSRNAQGLSTRRQLAKYSHVYDFHELPALQGQPVQVLLADLTKILQLASQQSTFWERALRSCSGSLTPIIYHDEVTAGNILHPVKRKKVLAVYLGFREMRESLHLKKAWLPLALLQRQVLDTVDGGLSAVCVELLKKLHSAQNLRGVVVPGCGVLRVAPSSRLLSDQDAQRATYNNKGSSGIVVCLYCSNCLSAEHCHEVPGAIGIHEWDMAKFRTRTDEDFFHAVEEMRNIRGRAELALREKAMGVNRNLRGLMFDAVARRLLPPSQATVDVLHAYYSTGCASWEICYLLRHMERMGVDPSEIREAAIQAEWRLAHAGTYPGSATVRSLLHDKLLKDAEEKHYRGQAHETRKTLLLLGYYADLLLSGVPDSENIRRSLALLVRCCRELRILAASWRPLAAGDADALRAAQAAHQQAFVEAWGAEACKPKHHHRMHIPDAAENLGYLPDCGLQEKKHQILKGGGLLDNQKRSLGKSMQLQQAVLSRMLESSLPSDVTFAKWTLEGQTSPASACLRRRLQDDTLCSSDSMCLHGAQVKVYDVVMWPDGAAGIVK